MLEGYGLMCLTPLSTIFQLYRFIGGGNHQPTLSHTILSSTPHQDSNSLMIDYKVINKCHKWTKRFID
jgi:hypothetical protein